MVTERKNKTLGFLYLVLLLTRHLISIFLGYIIYKFNLISFFGLKEFKVIAIIGILLEVALIIRTVIFLIYNIETLETKLIKSLKEDY